MKKLVVSISPHIVTKTDTSHIMRDVLIALVPALVASVMIFGLRALLVTAVCVAACVAGEFLFEKIVKKPVTVRDLSACVTGVLLAFNLPVSIPLWQAVFGSLVAIVIVKQLFGGIGQNFANPAIVARVVMLLAFSGAMTAWTFPDGVSGATPLALIADAVSGATSGATSAATTAATSAATAAAGGELPSIRDMLLGIHGGSLGETCSVALIIGGIYLLVRRVIAWHIPVAFMGTVALFTWALDANPVYQLLSGGLILGAIFMATDYSTSPVTKTGRVIFGIGCGLITVLIRVWGNYPEGVSFAILLMNILAPHISRLTRTRPFGGVKI